MIAGGRLLPAWPAPAPLHVAASCLHHQHHRGSSSSRSSARSRHVASAIVIRPGTQADVEAVAEVCGEAFGHGLFPGMEQTAQVQQVEQRYAAAIKRELKDKVKQSLQRKLDAGREHRAQRLRRSALAMRAQLALLEGRPATLPTRPTPDERRAEARWMRARQYMCLVAEDRPSPASSSPLSSSNGHSPLSQEGAHSQQQQPQQQAQQQEQQAGEARPRIIGTVALCLSQPEALLPPPFPSTTPTRLYVSNMAVLPGYRRKGVARALLRACMRTAELWGFDSLWLHVHQSKAGVMQLYTQEGFQRAAEASPAAAKRWPTFLSLMGEVLMVRRVEGRKGRRGGGAQQPGALAEDTADLLALAAEAAWAQQAVRGSVSSSSAERSGTGSGSR